MIYKSDKHIFARDSKLCSSREIKVLGAYITGKLPKLNRQNDKGNHYFPTLILISSFTFLFLFFLFCRHNLLWSDDKLVLPLLILIIASSYWIYSQKFHFDPSRILSFKIQALGEFDLWSLMRYLTSSVRICLKCVTSCIARFNLSRFKIAFLSDMFHTCKMLIASVPVRSTFKRSIEISS